MSAVPVAGANELVLDVVDLDRAVHIAEHRFEGTIDQLEQYRLAPEVISFEDDRRGHPACVEDPDRNVVVAR